MPGVSWPGALGTEAISAIRPDPLRNLQLLPASCVVHGGIQQANVRARAGAGPMRVRALRLRICCHAGACAPPTQRTTARHAGRRAQIGKAGCVAAPDWQGRAVLAEALIRLQYPEACPVRVKASLLTYHPGYTWLVCAGV